MYDWRTFGLVVAWWMHWTSNAEESDPPLRQDSFERLTGASELIRETVECARLISRSSGPILLQGESGVGKALFARAIHDAGDRAQGPFVTAHCGGLSRELLASDLFGYRDGLLLPNAEDVELGKIEAAQGGTLFLEAIDQLPLDLQAFLLRVLETGAVYRLGSTQPRKVDFRLVCSSEQELATEVREGRFRRDLYYRLAWASLRVPPLRERPEDLRSMAEQIRERALSRFGLSPRLFEDEVFEAFARYDWPGNVRELNNVVESMVLLHNGERIGVEALPPDLKLALERDDAPDAEPLDDASLLGLERVERDAIGACLRQHGGNLTRTARALRIARSTLYAKLKKYGLEQNVGTLRFGSVKRPSLAPAEAHAPRA